ncbi:MAG: hypothetical protein BV457_09305 [Thermoplasmata archaeon M9B1D]|nr:MAG: hypothetical protein BV457_09305 [Thermoplasmata archaeon M9B1D]
MDNENIKQFSINDIQMFRADEDVDFMHVKIWALGDGNNSHHNPISTEVLTRDADTILGKFLIAKFDKYENDVTTHVPNQQILGYVPPNQEVKIEEKDGKNFITVDGLVSKIYATDVVNMFRNGISQREVSCEFSCQESDVVDENGDTPILRFFIHGITFLGLKYHASSAGSEVKVMQFAEQFENNNNLKSFAEKRMKQLKEEEKNLVSHPMDKSKEALDTSDWNGDKAKDDLLKEKNYLTLAKSVCLQLEDGWKDRKKGSLKYPVMNLKNGKWVYNKEGLDSADSYSEQHDPAVQKKVTEIKKKLGLYKEESMADIEEKKFTAEEDVVMEAETKETKKPEEDKAKEEEKEMGCHMEEEKKFSLDAYVDSGAMLALLEAETETYKGLANKVMKEMSAEDIVMEFVKVVKERDELKTEKDKEEKDKTEKKFMSIMAEYKEGLSTDNFVKLYEEGKILKFEELDGFVNKIKSFAEEVEKKEDDRIFKFAGTDNSIKEHVDEDVFDRIKKK